MWNRIKWLPLAMVSVVYPLIAGLEILDIPFMEFAWFPNVVQWTDVFLVRRKVFIYAMAAVMLVLIVWKYHEYMKDKCLWPLLGYAGWNVLSTVLSEYREYGLHGIMESQETLFVLIGYVILAVYTYCAVKESKTACSDPLKNGNGLRVLVASLVLGDFLVSCVGITQVMNHDFWMTELGKRIIVSEQFASYRETIQLNYGVRQVYGGFYNPKYAAIYFLMMMPVLIAVILGYVSDVKSASNRIWKGIRITAGITLVFSLINIVFSDAVTVYICAGILILTAIVLHIVKEPKRRKTTLTVCAAGILLSGILYGACVPSDTNTERLESIRFLGTFLEIKADGETYWLREAQTDEGILYPLVLDEDKKMPVLQWREDGLWGLPEGMTQNLAFQVYTKDDIVYTILYYKDIPMRFILQEDQCKYISIYGKIGNPEEAETMLPHKEKLLSGRGYIWGRTMPLIRKHWITGTGPESFMLAFPQEDYVARANLGWGFFSEIIGNAHSLYLQIAVQCGIPGLILFLYGLFVYLKTALANCLAPDWKNIEELERRERYMRICVMSAVLVYSICGITWASNISIAPIFWILLGLGMALENN